MYFAVKLLLTQNVARCSLQTLNTEIKFSILPYLVFYFPYSMIKDNSKENEQNPIDGKKPGKILQERSCGKEISKSQEA